MQNAIIKNTALAAVLATGTMFTTVAQAATIEAMWVQPPTTSGVV